MKPETLAKRLERLIEEAEDGLFSTSESVQDAVLKALLKFIAEGGFKTDNRGRILISGEAGKKNRKALAKIKAQLVKIANDRLAAAGSVRYIDAFAAVEKLQARYYRDAFSRFRIRDIREITRAAARRTGEVLSLSVQAGLSPAVSRVLDAALIGETRANLIEIARATIGTVYTRRNGQAKVLRNGALSGYLNRTVRDSLNIYSGAITEAVTTSLELDWVYYSAGTVRDSRTFCQKRAGKYFHIEEARAWASQRWEGKHRLTNRENILQLRGGYNCMHTIIPVPISRVPSSVVDRAREAGLLG